VVPVPGVVPPSPELLLSLSAPLLRRLVATFGPVDGLRPNAPVLAIVRAIFERRAAPKLARVLATVVGRFGTETGRRALVEAAIATGDARATEWLRMPAADVAATLAIEACERETETRKRGVRRVANRLLALAGMRLERELAERATYELLAVEPVARDRLVAALRGALGELVQEAWTREEADGALRAAVFVKMPAAGRLVLAEDAIAFRVDTPVAVDLLRVDAAGTRASLTLARPELLPLYARALGLSLRPSATLRAFQQLTNERLARMKWPPEVTKVTVVALRWRRPDGSRYEVRAFDALDPAHEGTAPRSGYVDRVTVRVQRGEKTIDAFLQLPHRLEVSDPSGEEIVREVLARIGVLAPGAMGDDARSLAPYEHGDWRWRSLVGDAGFEALVKARLLIRVTTAHVVTEELRMHGAGFVARDVPGEKGGEYALAEDRSLGARLVGKKERQAWRLDLGALGARMRKDLGCVAVGAPNGLTVEGVLDLGVVALASGKLRFVYAIATPPKGWEAALVRACGIGATPVVLVPAGHAGPEGVLTIGLDVGEQLGVDRVGRALGKAAGTMGVAGEVDPWRFHDEDVIVDAARRKVWVTGVLVGLSEKAYRFLEFLARRPGAPTTTKEIGAYVSSSGYPDDAARRIRGDVERQVRRSLLAAGAAIAVVDRLIVGEGKLGYRIGVTVRVVGEERRPSS
jgi:hypothetical protein